MTLRLCTLQLVGVHSGNSDSDRLFKQNSQPHLDLSHPNNNITVPIKPNSVANRGKFQITFDSNDKIKLAHNNKVLPVQSNWFCCCWCRTSWRNCWISWVSRFTWARFLVPMRRYGNKDNNKLSVFITRPNQQRKNTSLLSNQLQTVTIIKSLSLTPVRKKLSGQLAKLNRKF